jgi:DNA repair exonuclease SbcCD ATPase subunit
MTRRLLTLCLVGLAAAISYPVLAQAPAKTGSLGSGSGSGPVMTRDELRACIKQQASLQTMSDTYEAKKTQLDADRTALLAETQGVRGDLGDATEQAAKVNELNQRTAEVAERVNDWNVRWNEFQSSKRSGPIVDRQRRQLINEQKALKAENDALDAEREKLGGTGAGAAEANARSDALNARTVAWNDRNKALVAEGEKLAQERDLWASECGNRRYREDDETAIRQGK